MPLVATQLRRLLARESFETSETELPQDVKRRSYPVAGPSRDRRQGVIASLRHKDV